MLVRLTAASAHSANLTVAELDAADLRTAHLTGADPARRPPRRRGPALADVRSARWSGAVTGAAPAHYAELRGAADLAQAQSPAWSATPHTPAARPPRPRHPRALLWSCWPEPPPGFDALIERLARAGGQPADDVRAGLLCRTGTPCPAAVGRDDCPAR